MHCGNGPGLARTKGGSTSECAQGGREGGIGAWVCVIVGVSSAVCRPRVSAAQNGVKKECAGGTHLSSSKRPAQQNRKQSLATTYPASPTAAAAGSTTPAPAAGVGTRIKLWLKTLARPSKFLLDTAALAGVGVGPCVTWPETVTTSEGGCVPEAEPVRSVSSLEGA